MTGMQSLGVLTLLVGGAIYAKQRGLCVLCQPTTTAAPADGVTMDLWPENPSNLGTWFDTMIADLAGDKEGGNGPEYPATPSSLPLQAIPNLAPSVDEWLPPSPINPDLSAGIEDPPQLDAFTEGGSFEAVAWSVPPDTTVAGEPTTDEYLSPGV